MYTMEQFFNREVAVVVNRENPDFQDFLQYLDVMDVTWRSGNKPQDYLPDDGTLIVAAEGARILAWTVTPGFWITAEATDIEFDRFTSVSDIDDVI